VHKETIPFRKDNGETFETVLCCGDCLQGVADLDPGSIDVVVTSPPYNLGIKYGTYDDTIARHEYLDWMGEWAVAVARVLSPEGSLFLNVGGKPTDPWGPLEVAQKVRAYLQLQNTIHWIKSIAIDAASMGKQSGLVGDLAVGHYTPINSDRFLNDCHEYIFHFTHTGAVALDRLALGVPYQDKSNVRRWKSAGADLRCRGNTWFLPYETIRSSDRERPHPATFPVQLPEWCFRLHGLSRIRRCMDPFLGLGSSAIAAARLGLPLVGFELDPVYLHHAAERLRREERCCMARPPGQS